MLSAIGTAENKIDEREIASSLTFDSDNGKRGIMFEKITKLAEDSEENRVAVLKLRSAFSPELLGEASAVKHEQEALTRGMKTVQQIWAGLRTLGVPVSSADPGHGVGHWARDYVNALRLFSRLKVTPEETFIGLVAGSVHDLGCSLIYRYDEDGRVVRHAEVGALLLGFLFELDSFGLNQAEQRLIQYSVAAHTHYLAAKEVKDAQGGVIGKIEPYVDMVEGKPFYPVWLPRWVDRLDTNGPAYLGRHYLTLVNPHKEFDGKSAYDVDFAKAMRPLLRTKEERGKDPMTMAEHVRMYAESQNNESPYGKHDFGAMVELRDAYKERLLRVISSLRSTRPFALERVTEVLERWTGHLCVNNEPSLIGVEAAARLKVMFKALPEETQCAWAKTFDLCLSEYALWSYDAIRFMETIPIRFRHLPGVHDNLQSMLQSRG